MTQIRVDIEKGLHREILIEAARRDTKLKEFIPRLLETGLRHLREAPPSKTIHTENEAEVNHSKQTKGEEVLQL